MKDWQLYSARTGRYMVNRWLGDEKEKRAKAIGTQSLTDSERAAAITQMCKEVHLESREARLRESQISSELEKTFWVDAREELKYPSFLKEEGCEILEKMTRDSVEQVEFGADFVKFEWMFRKLESLVEFTKQVITNQILRG
jgi:hypothetical protein